MTLQRPTLQGRKGFNPFGTGPGVKAPYGYSDLYVGHHNGEDCFWLLKDSADRLGMTTEASKRIYPVAPGQINHTSDPALGLGLWQQLNADTRAYYWHLRDREPAGNYGINNTIGRMGATGTSSSGEEHLHFEIRKAPYAKANRVNPAPFFADPDFAGGDGTPITETDTNMPILVSLVQGNPPQHVGDYAIIGPGGVVGLQRDRDASLITTAKRAMWEREPIYGVQADQLSAIFAQVDSKTVAPTIDYDRLADEVAQRISVPTAAQNAQAVDAVLADDFTAVRADVNKPRTVQ